MFHKHKWIKIEKTYAPSCFEQGIKDVGKSDACWETLVFFKGLTTVLWECSICNKVKKIEMLGKNEEIKNENNNLTK